MIELPYESQINDEKIKSFVSFLKKEKMKVV